MQFPLKHPPFIVRDTQADNFTERTFYSGSLSKTQQTINITELLNNAIHLLDKNTNKINLQNITLVTISSVDIELTLLSLVISNLNANFNRVLFFTSEEIDKMKGSKIVVLNALRKETHPSHFTLDEAVSLLKYIQPEQAYLTHISHLMGFHEEVQKRLPSNVFLGYDNLKLTIK